MGNNKEKIRWATKNIYDTSFQNKSENFPRRNIFLKPDLESVSHTHSKNIYLNACPLNQLFSCLDQPVGVNIKKNRIFDQILQILQVFL